MHVEFMNSYLGRGPLEFALIPFHVHMVTGPEIFSIDLSTLP